MNGNEEVYIEICMPAIKKQGIIWVIMMCFNFVFNEMCHGTGSAANCDYTWWRVGKYYGNFSQSRRSDQFSFSIPKALFTERVCKLITDAKLLYGILLLDRISLSKKMAGLTVMAYVYIIYTIAELQELLIVAYNSNKASLWAWQCAWIGLIERYRQGIIVLCHIREKFCETD